MINRIDLSKQKWSLTGWTPELWRMHQTMEIGANTVAEIRKMECNIPCSVQQILFDNNIIEDWNIGFNYKKCEWVENRHWIYTTTVKGAQIDLKKKYTLSCLGLDYKGEVYVNTKFVGAFDNAYITYNYDITEYLTQEDNLITIVFFCPPRFLGQFGFTSKITDFKPRYYYTWDWTCRIVQTGIWDKVFLFESDNAYIDYVNIETDKIGEKGAFSLFGKMTESVKGKAVCKISSNNTTIYEREINIAGKEFSICENDLNVDFWNIYELGEQNLYDLSLCVLDENENILDSAERKIGFRNITWKKCEGACENAEPWICSINGNDIFIQGIDWVPLKQNFADVKKEDYVKVLALYKEIGVNLIRVWGGAVLEREEFYNLCDEMGIMVWQEFPMSSSGIDNYPPEDLYFIDGMKKVVSDYIHKRGYHTSLIIWCGGNELYKLDDGGQKYPVDYSHPIISEMKKVVLEENPGRRFIPASPTGTYSHVVPEEVGKGIHENTHGPWKAESVEEWNEYFDNDDSMFKAEAGAPGASSLDILEKYAGNLNAYPIVGENDYWSRPMNWWIETEAFKNENGRYPLTKEEYVDWSQKRQADLLYKALSTKKAQFPKCGGFIIWMGHDNYPCPANTSIIDFYRRLKPSAFAVKKVFKNEE